jgi:two-component system, NtrC family, sensor histidine kinase PilS
MSTRSSNSVEPRPEPQDSVLTVLGAEPAALRPSLLRRFALTRHDLFPSGDSDWFVKALRSTATARFALASGGVAIELYTHLYMGESAGRIMVWGLYYWAFTVFALFAAMRTTHNRVIQAGLGLGVDLIAAIVVHSMSRASAPGNTLLLVWPVIEAAVLGSGMLAVLVALSVACYLSLLSAMQAAGGIQQQPSLLYTILTSVGLLSVGVLTQQLASRLHVQEKERRSAERAMRRFEAVNDLALKELDDGVFVTDKDMRVETANPAALRMLGLSERALPASLTARAELSPIAVQVQIALIHRAQTESRVSWSRKGLSHEAQVQCRVTQAAGEDAIVVFLRDARRIEAQVHEAKLAAMGRLVAGIAHDIRNPLSAISQAAELIQERTPEAAGRLPAMIAANVSRINETVEDVLLLGARDRSRSQRLELHAWLDEWYSERQALDRATGVLTLTLDRGDPTVDFHADHLRRVINNLHDNAVRYASGKAGSIRVQTHCHETHVELTLSNDGPVIAEPLRTQIFEPFVSGESRGTGLGLYICKELCSQNRSTLDYRTLTGGHGEFVLNIPLSRASLGDRL